MSSPNHSQDWWVAYDDETNIGGGTAGAAYAKTAPTQNDLNALPYPMGSQNLPYVEYEQKKVKGAGDDIKTARYFLIDKLFAEAPYKSHIHNSTFLAKVIANIARTGQLPTGTMVWHWENGVIQEDVFGIWAKTYKIEMKKSQAKEFPSETQTLSYYDMAAGSDLTKIAFIQTQPLTPKNFHLGGYQEFGLTGKSASDATGLATSTTYYFKVNGIEYTFTTASTVTFTAIMALMNAATEVSKTTSLPANINFALSGGDLRCTGTGTCIKLGAGTTGTDALAAFTGVSLETPVTDTVDLREFSVELKLETGEDEGSLAGYYERRLPYIEDFDLSIMLKFKIPLSTILDDTLSTTQINNDLAIWIDYDQDDTLDSGELLVLHNVRVIPQKTTINELPEFGLKEYTLEMDMGSNFSIALPTW